MKSDEAQRWNPVRSDGQFATTHWSVVLSAGRDSSPNAHKALARLCQSYWYPLYAFVRRRGYPPEEAKDLTQDFFAHFLGKDCVKRVDPKRGRFRTFLLSSLDHFLCNEWDKRNAIKRGGGCTVVSWDEWQAEDRYQQEPHHDLSADRLFDRRWALELIGRVMDTLRREHERAGEKDLFEALHGCLTGDERAGTYRELAERLQVSEAAVRMRAHRLRRQFAQSLRAEVAETVAGAGELDEEMRHLFAALG